ncbi:hypothetical protein CAEBREN_02164 [Caenorhabditis brenneri]|uniref:Uncharacterized protein n=1 Tax=Caenorhabditis brenneri TaxID=135651 RepID=G0N438_CAEBE|nr:hypothetical protein CAEBREN_02164 [Caenorhabditis brenneri]
MNHEFSAIQIVAFVTEWFNSTNTKLNYLRMHAKKPIPRERFQIAHLNPMPFCENRRRRQPRTGPFSKTDLSGGFDILRSDGLLATFQVWRCNCALYVWHQRF